MFVYMHMEQPFAIDTSLIEITGVAAEPIMRTHWGETDRKMREKQ